MKRPARFLRVFGAAGLLLSLLAATIGPATAQQELPASPGLDGMLFESTAPEFRAGPNAIYYPWVANGEDFGLGDSRTSISVQNLEDRDAQIWIYTGNNDGGFDLATTAALSAYASKTFSAADLEIAEGDGSPVAVLAYHREPAGTVPGIPAGGFLAETTVTLSKPAGVAGDFTQVFACVVNAYTPDGSFGTPFPFVAAETLSIEGPSSVVTISQGDLVEWSTEQDLQVMLNAANLGNTGALVNPFGGVNQDGDCLDAIDDVGTPSFLDSVAIGGVAKQAVEGGSLPITSVADTAVSGYNAVNGLELAQFDEWYLPIVQTNCGPGGCWDSMIRVANLSSLNNAVTIRFFPADDGSGSLADRLPGS